MKRPMIVCTPGVRLGFALSILAVMTFLGVSCTDIPTEDNSDLVTVSVSIPQQNARSITSAQAQAWCDYYEVIFKNNTNYYKNSVKRDGGRLTVTLPVGAYEMLFLAGNYDRNILLLSEYQTAVNIAKGMAPIAVNPNLIDLAPAKFTFTYAGGIPTTALSPASGVAASIDILKSDDSAITDSEFKVEIDLGNVSALACGGTDVTFKKSILYFDSTDDSFYVAPANGGTSALTLSSNNVTVTYTIQKTSMPDVDGMGKLYFELEYQPFGASSGLATWFIRNGLTYNDDINGQGNGSAIVVKVGDGSSGETVQISK